MQEHIAATRAGDLYSPIGKHMPVTHKYRLPPFKFMALTRVHPDLRGGMSVSFEKKLLGSIIIYGFE